MWLQAAAQARAQAHGPGAPGTAGQHSPQAALQWRAGRRVAALSFVVLIVAHALGSCSGLMQGVVRAYVLLASPAYNRASELLFFPLSLQDGLQERSSDEK